MSAHGLIGRWLGELRQLSQTDRALEPVAELLNTALIQVEEAGDTLRDYLQGLELNRSGWCGSKTG